MERITLRLSLELKERLDMYCQKKETKANAAIRDMLIYWLDKEDRQGSNKKTNSGENNLLINEQQGHRSSVESLFLLRYLVADKEVLEDIRGKALAVLEDGWQRENTGD